MNAWIALGLLLAALGSFTVYLASPHQRCADRPLGAGVRMPGWMLCAAGFVALQVGLQAVAAALVFATWLMLLFVFWPFLGVLMSAGRK